MSSADNVTNELGNNNNDYYKHAIIDFVINQKMIPRTNNNDFDLDQYINMFSFYMKNSNEAYKYNQPYLRYQHDKFKVFLLAASEKIQLLRKIVGEIKSAKEIKELIQDGHLDPELIRILLNDFLVSDLTGKISLQESFSFAGAKREVKYDVVTIMVNKKNIISCHVEKATASDNTYGHLVGLFMRMMSEHSDNGGADKNGND